MKEAQQLPPWPKKRRIIALSLMTGYILVTSALIGIGIYQVGLDLKLINRPYTKKDIYDQLVNDAGFWRAVKKSATSQSCVNSKVGLSLNYQSPLTPLSTQGDEACLEFVAMHPTGADVWVRFEKVKLFREEIVNQTISQFKVANTDIVSGTKATISSINGIKDGIATQIYVMEVSRQQSMVVSYSPTSPTLDGKVQAMVDSLVVQ